MRKILSIDEEIILNQFSQGLFTLEEMNNWFVAYDLLDKRDIVQHLLNMVIQSHPTYNDIENSAISLKKVTSASAIKLLNRKKPFNKFGYEIYALPEKELQVGFDILLLTLAKADRRRREQEDPKDCNHWWHKDLSDENYLQRLKRGDFL